MIMIIFDEQIKSTLQAVVDVVVVAAECQEIWACLVRRVKLEGPDDGFFCLPGCCPPSKSFKDMTCPRMESFGFFPFLKSLL